MSSEGRATGSASMTSATRIPSIRLWTSFWYWVWRAALPRNSPITASHSPPKMSPVAMAMNRPAPIIR